MAFDLIVHGSSGHLPTSSLELLAALPSAALQQHLQEAAQ
jgi:hypothetical protein